MIWASARELGFDEELLRDVVAAVTGKRKISTLTKKTASDIIDKLKFLKGEGVKMLTGAQRQKIDELVAELGWDEKRLRGFLKKYAGVEAAQWLTRKKAQSIIEGLKALRRDFL